MKLLNGMLLVFLRKYAVRLFLLVFMLGVLLVSMFVYTQWQRFLTTPLFSKPASQTFIIKPGTTVRKLSLQLAREDILKYPNLFEIYVRRSGQAQRIRAGEYEVKNTTTPPGLLKKITRGEVLQHSFTVVEGWTFRELKAHLTSNPALKHTLNGLSDKEIMVRLGYPGESPEGRFFPDTYFFTRETTDLAILKEAYRHMIERLTSAWKHRSPHLPYASPYQGLIVASLIEKETALAPEKDKIAAVILRRLKRKMKLQIDSTVVYALGLQYDGNLTKKNLRIESPFNTYRYYGLPPTPIAMPGEDSLQAAFHPDTVGHYLYFVAKGDGGHYFSDSLKAHRIAIKKYLLQPTKKEKEPQPTKP